MELLQEVASFFRHRLACYLVVLGGQLIYVYPHHVQIASSLVVASGPRGSQSVERLNLLRVGDGRCVRLAFRVASEPGRYGHLCMLLIMSLVPWRYIGVTGASVYKGPRVSSAGQKPEFSSRAERHGSRTSLRATRNEP